MFGIVNCLSKETIIITVLNLRPKEDLFLIIKNNIVNYSEDIDII